MHFKLKQLELLTTNNVKINQLYKNKNMILSNNIEKNHFSSIKIRKKRVPEE